MVGIIDFVAVILILIIVGVLLWLINRFIPMDSKIKQILNIVVVIVVVVWLLQGYGIIGSLRGSNPVVVQ